jgi:hypothetical protein
MAGAVPDLASGSAGSAHHLWVGRVAFGWLLWVAWQTGLLYDDSDVRVGGCAVVTPNERVHILAQHGSVLQLQ